MIAQPRQSRWPAVLAHQVLPRVIFDDTGAKALGLLGHPELARPFLNYLVDNVAQCCGFPEGAWKRLAADIRLHRCDFGAVDGIVLEMPPPQIPPDCYFIAVIPVAADRPRYFTLECAFFPPTMLCEWTADRTHANFGPGPDADTELFIAAVIELLKDQQTRDTIAPL
jgi:hypothetical protein